MQNLVFALHYPRNFCPLYTAGLGCAVLYRTSLCLTASSSDFVTKVENARTNTEIQSAINLYFKNRNTITTILYPRKDGSQSRTKKTGITIRRFTAIHNIPLSQLQRAIAAGGELAIQSKVEIADLGLPRFAYYLATYALCICTPYHLSLSYFATFGCWSVFTIFFRIYCSAALNRPQSMHQLAWYKVRCESKITY